MKGKVFSQLISAGLVLGGLVSGVAIAASEPPAQVLQAAPGMQKIGEGAYRWWGLHVYDAQLWAASNKGEFDYRATPNWLELRYARDFDGSDIAEKSREEIEEQGQVDPSLLDEWEKKLAALFPNVKEGDTLSALYIPGQPAQFFHNNKPIGTLKDVALAKAFMGIWLDEKSSAPDLRRELIGLKQ